MGVLVIITSTAIGISWRYLRKKQEKEWGFVAKGVYDKVGTRRMIYGSVFTTILFTDGSNCTVVEIAGSAETELARCADGGPTPCWNMYADPAACPGGDNVGISVRRGNTAAPASSKIEATCFVK